MNKPRRELIKDVLWCLALAGLAASVIRFSQGLGAATGLDDSTPWGLWIAFDVMAGVALAAGGFVLADSVRSQTPVPEWRFSIPATDPLGGRSRN